MALLLREAIGDRLRRVRNGQHRTLREVSRAARVSLGYLSEVERGRKEASSELLAAICGALKLPLADLLREVAFDLGDGVPEPSVDRGDRRGELERDDFERRFNRELDKVIEGGRLAGMSVGEAKAELQVASRLAQRLTQPGSQSPVRPLPNAELSAESLSAMFAA
jgi:transcriptional regulator with XRE-family HTH domain